jgi:hypothetical protein
VIRRSIAILPRIITRQAVQERAAGTGVALNILEEAGIGTLVFRPDPSQRGIFSDRLRARGGPIMARTFGVGDCVRIPDGRIGRVREVFGGKYRVRVRRATSATHQFLLFAAGDLSRVDCPKGWMSPEGYARYLKVTLAKMRKRQARSGKAR